MSMLPSSRSHTRNQWDASRVRRSCEEERKTEDGERRTERGRRRKKEEEERKERGRKEGGKGEERGGERERREEERGGERERRERTMHPYQYHMFFSLLLPRPYRPSFSSFLLPRTSSNSRQRRWQRKGLARGRPLWVSWETAAPCHVVVYLEGV